MTELKLYRIRDSIGDEPITDFDHVVDVGDRAVQEFGPTQHPGFAAKLYVTRTFRQAPPWAEFVEAGFEEDDLALGHVQNVSALLVLRIDDPHQLFAIAFSHGRHLLRDGVWVGDFGLRTALNLIYPTATEAVDASQLRVVDRKRVGENTALTRTQVARPATLDLFDVDRLRDMVRRVTGRPQNKEMWGSRVDGGDGLTVSANVDFAELGNLCTGVDYVYERPDYRERFSFIDDVRGNLSSVERRAVEASVVDVLRAGDPDALFELAPPEILDWERAAKFQFDFDRANDLTRTEFLLRSYLGGLKPARQEALTQNYLRTHYLYALDGDGTQVGRWSIWRCLTGSLQVDGHTYVLDAGEIYRVAGSFLEELDQTVEAIEQSDLALPDSPGEIVERAYNELAVQHDPDLLLLDRKQVVADRGVTPIELCDLLSPTGCFIHVKRHFASSGLSHLFNQGLVSAETLHLDSAFRERVAEFVTEQGGADHAERISSDPFSPRVCEIVYAIVGPWQGRSLVEALPFFSKITLRHAYQELTGMGFRVTYRPIPIAGVTDEA